MGLACLGESGITKEEEFNINCGISGGLDVRDRTDKVTENNHGKNLRQVTVMHCITMKIIDIPKKIRVT